MTESFADDMEGDDAFADICHLFAATGQSPHDDDFAEASPESLMRTRVAVPTVQSGQLKRTLPAMPAALGPPVPVTNATQSGCASHAANFTMLSSVVPPLIALSPSPLQQTFSSISGAGDSGKVKCPFCPEGRGKCLSGATRGTKYSYMCNICDTRWNQLRVPNEYGDFEVTLSNRKIGLEPRRSGGYACGKCGAKPKFGHVCPYRGVGVFDAAIKDRSSD
eukprot:1888617-Prymnesium_polylepis.1